MPRIEQRAAEDCLRGSVLRPEDPVEISEVKLTPPRVQAPRHPLRGLGLRLRLLRLLRRVPLRALDGSRALLAGRLLRVDVRAEAEIRRLPEDALVRDARVADLAP